MKVLLAFNDTSLGGTSRSAFEFAKLWQQAGAEVVMYSASAPHQSRTTQINEQGISCIDQITPQILGDQTLIHIHHAAPNPKTLAWVRTLVDMLPDPSPAILTHNIFGQDLGINFPEGRTLIGLLGHWLAQQHIGQNSNASTRKRRIVPNPQDLELFRPPSEAERLQARARLGLARNAFVVLRVGSPSPEKWAIQPYVRLSKKIVMKEHTVLRLVGCPPELQAKLPIHDRVIIVPPIADDLLLREEYWAADTFAHWASRGESFGNVIVEALGTGLPVVYKSRQLRDNTPWEFRDVPGFYYVRTLSKWICHSVRVMPRRSEWNSMSLQRYGSRNLEEVLSKCVKQVDAANPSLRTDVTVDVLSSVLEPPSKLPAFLRMQIFLRHNRLTSWVKAVRWRI